jgi:threonine dehydratase
VIGVEVDASTPFTASLAAGRLLQVPVGPSLADGLVGNVEAGSITFPLVQAVTDGVVTVTDDDIRSAMRGLAAEEHLIVEASGTVGVAAILSGRIAARDREVAAIVTGGNIDLAKFLRVVSR